MKMRLTSLTVIVVLMSVMVLGPLGVKAEAKEYQVKNNLKNIPVQGLDPETFEGKLEILGFTFEDGTGHLLLNGVLDGTATDSTTGTVTKVTKQTFTAPVTSFTGSAVEGVSIFQGPAEPIVCDILFLDIGEIFLNLLGLTIELSQIILDVDAVPGEGNLLGNLLCAILNLLNP